MTSPEPPVTPQAITAAAQVLTRSKHAWIPATPSEEATDRAIAKRMLEAAAPHLEAAARERCAQLIEAEMNRPGAGGGLPGVNLALQHVAALLRQGGGGGAQARQAITPREDT